MTKREKYEPGAAAGADARKDGETWTLILVRDLGHPPAIDRRFISWGAAGWHVCLDVLDRLLTVEYAKQFGVDAPSW